MASICPSTNPVMEDLLVNYCKEMQSYNVEFMHCDVMDGKFVRAKCLPVKLIKEISHRTLIGLDIHLMIDNPLDVLEQYLEIKANFITLHIEAFDNIQDFLKAVEMIHSKGILAGISIKPHTHVNSIVNLLPSVDLVLVMSVEPGRSGQSFNNSALEKIENLFAIRKKNKLNYLIEVDGGINITNAQSLIDAGADMLVMGSALYGVPNKKEIIDLIQSMKKYEKSLSKVLKQMTRSSK